MSLIENPSALFIAVEPRCNQLVVVAWVEHNQVAVVAWVGHNRVVVALVGHNQVARDILAGGSLEDLS